MHLSLTFKKFKGKWYVSSGCKGYNILVDFGNFLSDSYESTQVEVIISEEKLTEEAFKVLLSVGENKYGYTLSFSKQDGTPIVTIPICSHFLDMGLEKDTSYFWNVISKK